MDQPIVARDMMVRNLVTLSPEMDTSQAIDVLLRHRISGAPVVDTWGRFLGIFSEKSSLEFVIHTTYDALPADGFPCFVDQAACWGKSAAAICCELSAAA